MLFGRWRGLEEGGWAARWKLELEQGFADSLNHFALASKAHKLTLMRWIVFVLHARRSGTVCGSKV